LRFIIHPCTSVVSYLSTDMVLTPTAGVGISPCCQVHTFIDGTSVVASVF
jgi:hypothetical protein